MAMVTFPISWVRNLARVLAGAMVLLLATQAGAVSLQLSKLTDSSPFSYTGSFSAMLGEAAGAAQLQLVNNTGDAARITRIFIQDLDHVLQSGPPGAAPPITLSGDFPQASTYDVRLDSGGANKLAVVKIVKDFTGLGLKEAKDLVDAAPAVVAHNLDPSQANVLRQALLEAGASAVSVPIGGTGVGLQINLPQQQVTSAYDVVLTAGGANKLAVVKVVKDATGLGLKEAKDLVDSAPAVVLKNADPAVAAQLAQLLSEAGGTAALKAIGSIVSVPIVLPGGGHQIDPGVELLLDYHGQAGNPDLLVGMPLDKPFAELLGTPGNHRFRLGLEIVDASGADLYVLSSVPEPEIWWMLCTGLLLLAARTRARTPAAVTLQVSSAGTAHPVLRAG